MNIQGLVPKTVSSKIPYVKDLLTSGKQLFIGLSETWLKDHKEAELSIPNYTPFRADRIRQKKRPGKGRESGGVALYIIDSIASSFEVILSFSNGTVEALCVYSKLLNLVLCIIYRQPDDSTHGFPSRNPELKAALNKIEDVIMKLGDPLPDIIFGGDFNLPHVRWPECVPSSKCVKTEREMIQTLNDFLNCFCLHQIVTKPTHVGGNLLDCIFVNNEVLVHAVSVNEVLPSISHHKLVEVSTKLCIQSSVENNDSNGKLNNRFDCLNFFHCDISWADIISSFQQIDWGAEFQDKSVDDMLNIFYEKCYTICDQYVPKRKTSKTGVSKLEKYRKKLCRRRRRINKTLINVRSSQQKNKLSSELIDIEKKLTKSYKEERDYQEHIALGSIKKNVKYFYKYVRRFSKVK